jgi:hypothetical protein
MDSNKYSQTINCKVYIKTQVSSANYSKAIQLKSADLVIRVITISIKMPITPLNFPMILIVANL